MTAKSPRLGTLGVAIVTPFTDDLEHVDHEALANLTRYLVDLGHDLIVANGTTGESATTSDEEKHAIVKTIREAAGNDITILAGVGTNDTRHSLKLARETKEHGHADGLLVVTPYYSKPTQQGVIDHMTAIADATDLPIMLYDIPGRAGIALGYETIIELSKHRNIVALKEAKGDMHGATKIARDTKLDLYSGEDALNLPWLSVGAVGFVSVTSHITGRLDRLMLDAVQRGDFTTARRIHVARACFVDSIMNQGPGVMSAKAALAHLGVLPNAKCRAPLGEVEPEIAARVRSNVDALKATVAQFEK